MTGYGLHGDVEASSGFVRRNKLARTGSSVATFARWEWRRRAFAVQQRFEFGKTIAQLVNLITVRLSLYTKALLCVFAESVRRCEFFENVAELGSQLYGFALGPFATLDFDIEYGLSTFFGADRRIARHRNVLSDFAHITSGLHLVKSTPGIVDVPGAEVRAAATCVVCLQSQPLNARHAIGLPDRCKLSLVFILDLGI